MPWRSWRFGAFLAGFYGFFTWLLQSASLTLDETSFLETARETYEELGVQIEPDSAIRLCRLQIGPEEESVHFSAWIVGEWEGTPTNAAPEEHDEIRWFRPGELPPLAHEPMRTALVEAMRDTRA